ncbi:hypothetical protein Tco_0908877 [Tanacetum coccineum]|uniref:Uncharacterized protein n=1 Tax=Tanacetum coccineum TaxID=301880 RepID=A0ABQ5CQ92_9ASTR
MLALKYGLVPQRQKASDYDNPDPAPELQNVFPSADTTVPSQQELDLLFGPLYDEFFNDDKMKEKGDSCILGDNTTHPKEDHVTTKNKVDIESIHLIYDESKEITETAVA